MRHRPPDRTLFAGALCCCAGIAWFLAAGRPSAPRPPPCAMMTAGIFALAHRAPHVVKQQSTPQLAPDGRQASG
jgi:hypothetical protein